MNELARHLPTTHASDSPKARPKVMRRPPAKSHPVTEEVPAASLRLVPLTQAPTPEAATTTATNAWYEDSRFALALLLVVCTINLVLYVILPPSNRPAPVLTQGAAESESRPGVNILDDSRAVILSGE